MRRFVLAHSPGPLWAMGAPYAAQQGIEAHFGFMHSLAQRGLLLAGGPYAEAGDADGRMVGMAIIEADDLAAAEAIAAEDGSVRAGLMRVEVREWGPRMGSWLDAGD
jgi:uncharacterized protein YciI